MAPSFSSAAQGNQPSPQLGADRKRQKYRSMNEIMKVAKRVVLVENEESDDGDYYTRVACDQCGSGERAEELLLCDKCDKGYHMLCLRPIVVRVPIGPWFCPACSDDQDRPLKSIKSPIFIYINEYRMWIWIYVYIIMHKFVCVFAIDWLYVWIQVSMCKCMCNSQCMG